MKNGVSNGGEVLFLMDECASFAAGLEALEQAFQLGRGRGIRLMTFWQTIEQAQAAFKNKPSLVLDNSDHVFFGIKSYPTAELVSKMLGNWTMTTTSFNESASGGSSYSAEATAGNQSRQRGWSESVNTAQHARALLDPAEILQLSGIFFIAFLKDVPPLLGRRIKWYADPLFGRGLVRKTPLLWWAILAALIVVLVWSLRN
jgi:type IV secretion system protein VirD4